MWARQLPWGILCPWPHQPSPPAVRPGRQGSRVSGPGADVVAKPSPPQGLSVTQDDYSNRGNDTFPSVVFYRPEQLWLSLCGADSVFTPQASASKWLCTVWKTLPSLCFVPHIRMFSNPVQGRDVFTGGAMWSPHTLTPASMTLQTPLPMGFSRQEYWSGLPFPSPGDLPNLGIEPWSQALQADWLLSEPPGKAAYITIYLYNREMHRLNQIVELNEPLWLFLIRFLTRLFHKSIKSTKVRTPPTC